MPNNAASPVTRQGSFDADAAFQVNDTFDYTLISNTVAVTNTNQTAATDLMTGIIKGTTIGVVGEGFEVFAAGTYNLGAASTSVFTVKFAGLTLTTITTASNANTGVALNWNLTLRVVAVTVSGTSCTLECDGFLNYDGGATTAVAASVFNTIANAASSTFDPTVDQTLEIMHNLGSGNAASTVTQRVLHVRMIN